MKRLLVLSGFLLAVSPILATDKLINLQGKLTDAQGNPLSGNRVVTFRLYNNLNDPLANRAWEESQGINFASGLFNVSLGSGTTLDSLSFDKPYYLGVQVAGDDAEMSPRQLLGASAYALGSLGDFNVKKNAYVMEKLAVGTTSPAAKAHISGGNLRVEGGVAGRGLEIFNGASYVSGLTQGSNYTLEVRSSGDIGFYSGAAGPSAGTLGAVLTNSGNFGLGTASPSAKAHVSGGNLRVEGGVAGRGVETFNGSGYVNSLTQGSNQTLEVRSVGDIGFYSGAAGPSAGTLGVVLTNVGNLGIGIASPGSRLHVKTTGSYAAEFENSSTDANTWIKIANDARAYLIGVRGDQSDSFSIYDNAGAERLTIGSNGNVGIGAANPLYTLTVAGNTWCYGGAWTGSDMRWKKNVRPLPDDTLRKVMSLRGVTYDFKTEEFKDMNFPKQSQIGIIAQELEKQFPQLVEAGRDGYKGVDYARLSVVLLEAVKAQQKQIEAQQGQIEKLRNDLAELKQP